MKELIGKTVSELRVSDDQSVLAFVHPDGTHTAYATEGDCCSETWFADIIGVSALLGGTVLEVEDVEMPAYVDDGRSRQEVDALYGVKLRTSRGVVDIVYRNSSNGFYGGGIFQLSRGTPLYDLVPITDDWSA